jgi:hypothetical protein
MIVPDLLTVWPDTIDYPLFREWVMNQREHFSKVIIVFSKTNWSLTDLRPFIKESLKDVIFVDCDPVDGRDWRDAAVKTGLRYSDNEWVFFTEQDFFPQEDLWNEIQGLDTSVSVVGVNQGERVHPCCLIIKRELLNKTSLDFSANPPEYDHFGQIQKDLMNWNPPLVASTINPKLYIHMNGLSHNMFLMQTGQKVVYKPQEFKDYLQLCLQLPIQLHPEFVKLAKEYVA